MGKVKKAVKVAVRRERVVKSLAEGKRMTEVARSQDVSRMTVYRDTIAIRQQLNANTMRTAEEHRAEQLAKLQALESLVEQSDMDDEATVHALLAVHDRTARLLGLDLARPGAAVQVNVGADADSLEGYAKFKAATRFIHSPEKWQRIWDFIAQLGPDPITLTMPPCEVQALPEPSQTALAGDLTGEQQANAINGPPPEDSCV